MTNFLKLVSVLSLVGSTAIAGGHASGDATKGEKTMKKCKACHQIIDDEGTVLFKGGKTGPNLYGLAGRKAASVEGFRYGKSIMALGETDFVWDEAEFVSYVADPNKYLKAKLDDSSARSKMSFKLRKDEEALNVWAYIVSLSEQ